DLLSDQPCLLVMNKRLVVALRVLIDGADVVEHVRFVRKVADAAVDDERPAAGGKALLEAALVVVDGADVVVQDRLVPGSAYLQEDVQRPLVGVERVLVTAD